jgi:peptide/nickel transport system permease protein
LGTDRVGRDELSRVLYAMRSSVRLSAAVLAFGFLPGSLAALALGRLGKRISRVAADVADRSSAVPWVVVLLLAIRAYGFGLRPLAVCLSAYAFLSAVALAPSVADTTRGSYRTLWSRLRPAVAGRIGSAVAAAILGEATISFLGLAPGTRVSLGRDLSDARTSFPYNNWIEAAAGGALLLMLLGFNILRFAMDSESHPSGESLE